MGQLAEGLLGLSGWAALAFLFVLPALEAPAFLGLVLPGEVALILGGVLAARDRIPLAAALAVGTAGALAGDTAGYWIGRRWARGCWPPAWAAGSARPACTGSSPCSPGAAAGPCSWAAAPPGSGSCSPAWPACSACATGSSRPGPGRPRPSGRWPTSCSASPPGPAGATSTGSPAGSAWPWPWPSWSPGPSAGCAAGQVEVAQPLELGRQPARPRLRGERTGGPEQRPGLPEVAGQGVLAEGRHRVGRCQAVAPLAAVGVEPVVAEQPVPAAWWITRRACSRSRVVWCPVPELSVCGCWRTRAGPGRGWRPRRSPGPGPRRSSRRR